jgi:cytochrome c oxidase subunit 2
MWKLQHMEGRQEINELHVPLGQAVKLTLTSEDVIHSFYVPAFRIKMDAVPGRYTHTWFEATKRNVSSLLCRVMRHAHSDDRWVHVSSGRLSSVAAAETTACRQWPGRNSREWEPRAIGKSRASAIVTGPTANGRSKARGVADEDYLRESILNPHAKTSPISGHADFQGDLGAAALR